VIFKLQKQESNMKAQMFVITLVFLVGLVFVVLQSLVSDVQPDLSKPLGENDYYVMKNIKDVVNKTLQFSETCSDAEKNLGELVSKLNREILQGGYLVYIEYILDCSNWNNQPPNPPPLITTIKVTSKFSELTGTFEFYK